MCIIAVKSVGAKLPKEEHLRNCENRNKDGIGIALLKSGKQEILIKKDFKDVNEFIKWFYDNVKEEDACIIHYRYATHGLKDIGNRHPFPITKNKELLRKDEQISQTAVAHNGVISQYGSHAKYSDTQKFILDILSDDSVKNNLNNPAIQKLIGNFLGGDRLAIMLVNGQIFIWGDWETEGDIKYSNSGYAEKQIAWNYQKNIDWNKVSGAVDICDGCGEKKFIQCNEGTKYFALCKPCRKKFKKGKLIIEGNAYCSDEQEDETAEALEIQCVNCLEYKPVKYMTSFYGSDICLACYNETGIGNSMRTN